MDDLETFLNYLYEKQEGFVYVATKQDLPNNEIDWQQTFFNWPREAQQAKDFISLQGTEKDVYVGPSLYKSKSGLKSQVKGSNVVWVEFDGQEQIDFKSNDIPEPDVIVQTSSETHKHCYWKLEEFSKVDVVEDINRRLTYHLEADNTGWDANQVLRVPDSKNWKYQGIPVTMVKHKPGNKFKTKDFDSAPEIKQAVITIQDVHLQDPSKLLNELPLHAKLKRRILSETVEGPKDGKEGARSAFLMKIGHELAEEGCNHVQIVSLLAFVDDRIGKFRNRRDRLTRLSEIAARALLYLEAEANIVLYSPMDIINHTEDLDWLIEQWLHRHGFMILTGAPGVGKTTLGLQLMYHFATGLAFLEKPLEPQPRMLFLSLEMSIPELKFFFLKHNQEFQGNADWNNSLRIIDQEGSLLDYEEIIADFEPHVILLDSITELATQELKEEESRAITRWIKKIRRRYNCAFIAIHHNRKTGSGDRKKPTTLGDVYGSYIFGKDSDTVLNLEHGETQGTVELYSLKARYGPEFKSILTRNENLIFTLKEQNDSGPNITIGDGSVSINIAGLANRDRHGDK